jgi:hypothetical protein
MVYTAGLIEVMPRSDSIDDCGHCGGTIVWDEVHGWLHTTGWYACRWPQSCIPRKVMAEPAVEERP